MATTPPGGTAIPLVLSNVSPIQGFGRLMRRPEPIVNAHNDSEHLFCRPTGARSTIRTLPVGDQQQIRC